MGPKIIHHKISLFRYEKLYVMVIKSSTNGSIVEQLNLYELTSDPSQPPKLMHILHLNLDGLVATHVIDNLVIVHHKVIE